MMRVVAVGVAALVVAGCGSDETAAPATSPSAVAATSILPETTPSTAAPESTPAPTSPASTTQVTTTLPATTTTVATEDLIKTAVQDYISSFFACGQAPAQCDPTSFTATAGPSRRKLTELVQSMSSEGLYFSTDTRGSYLIAESVNPDSDTHATAIYCVFDALSVLGPNGPDGLPTVVNDAISSSRYTYGLFLQDGAWVVGEQQQLQRLGEGSLCPPA